MSDIYCFWPEMSLQESPSPSSPRNCSASTWTSPRTPAAAAPTASAWGIPGISPPVSLSPCGNFCPASAGGAAPFWPRSADRSAPASPLGRRSTMTTGSPWSPAGSPPTGSISPGTALFSSTPPRPSPRLWRAFPPSPSPLFLPPRRKNPAKERKFQKKLRFLEKSSCFFLPSLLS